MASTPPSPLKIIDDLRKETKNVFCSEDRDFLSVKYVRQRVEVELGLADGILWSGEWRTICKRTIREETVRLLAGEEKGSVESVSSRENGSVGKKRAKRDVDGDGEEGENMPAKKRRRKGPMPVDGQNEKPKPPKSKTNATATVKSKPVAKRSKKEMTVGEKEGIVGEEEQVEDDLIEEEEPKAKGRVKAKNPNDKEESEGEEPGGEVDLRPTKRKANRSKMPSATSKTQTKNKNKTGHSDEPVDGTPAPKSIKNDDGEGRRIEGKKNGTKQNKNAAKSKSRIDNSDSEPNGAPETNIVEVSDDELKPTTVTVPNKTSALAQPEVEAEINAHDSDSSVMSIVLDGPATNRTRKYTSKSKSSTTTTGPKTTKTKPPSAPPTAAETEIKALQTQLVSCGVRKIWQFELKAHGEDEKAKIRHLRDMLRDVGMVGRYSKARAREIKEERELRADLEAVRAGEKAWGLDEDDGMVRPARKGIAGRKIVGGHEEDVEGDGDDGESDEIRKGAAEKRKRNISELAFLGDESDSD